MPSRHQLARVAVSPETWLTFRRAALGQGISVAAYLGRLVDAEVKRRGDRPIAELDRDAPQAEQGIVALAEVRASIDELDAFAGRLARSAVAHGGSWSDVASSLRITRDQAAKAYGEKR
jgi:hypothetical protein